MDCCNVASCIKVNSSITEFINRTKQTYLNIKGEYKDIGFENKINVHLFINNVLKIIFLAMEVQVIEMSAQMTRTEKALKTILKRLRKFNI